MNASVRPPSRSDQAWADLGTELTPARSLARIDNATARTVTTITVIGVLLTALGLLSATQIVRNGTARGLAVATVISAVLAVGSALSAQLLTITRDMNAANLQEVKAWYRRQFIFRAYSARAATILLLIATLLAGSTSVADLTAVTDPAPAIEIDQIAENGSVSAPTTRPGEVETTITVKTTFPGLHPGQVATVTVTAANPPEVLARATVTADPNGTAAVTIIVPHIQASKAIKVIIVDAGELCSSIVTLSRSQPILHCAPIG